MASGSRRCLPASQWRKSFISLKVKRRPLIIFVHLYFMENEDMFEALQEADERGNVSGELLAMNRKEK